MKILECIKTAKHLPVAVETGSGWWLETRIGDHPNETGSDPVGEEEEDGGFIEVE
ncbi:hypothetical protein HanXRQr2_Chr11g0516241 [Helianthus annuus]|uniref:Uncharacterized protein n=1 Tax=Helianthus annuus TaxID=4232 RepID=A0A9K3HTU3_HELAN|nr:hypothetical protein HanXRQr2_Chr11g0516241 [Helianthus annuus]KAJ0877217.1 hypothetical protein HanPSC8_Chr11g0497541 [Helianthus annuus]